MQSSRTEATIMINEIVANCNVNSICEISSNCMKLTRHLFTHQYLLYTDLNNLFESSGILTVLMQSLDRLEEQARRNILRLIHLLLHANRSLRDNARHSEDFQNFLRRTFETVNCWKNCATYKHHINIASLLLSDREKNGCSFNTAAVRKYALQKIEFNIANKVPDQEDSLSIVVFYACSLFTTTFEDIPTNNADEPRSEKILTKELTGRCFDILRDYVQDFKLFYGADGESDKKNYILYKAKSEFSFTQIINTCIYYAVQSNILRMNIFQSGLYHIINNLFSLNDIPEQFLGNGIDILRISLLDEAILEGVKNEFLMKINTKLDSQKDRKDLSDNLKLSISNILKKFQIIKTSRNDETSSSETTISSLDIPSGDFVRPTIRRERKLSLTVTDHKMSDLSPSISVDLDEWSNTDVSKWLIDNKLQDLREIFSYLTGGGLKQLQNLAKQEDRIKFIELLTGTMRIRFDLTLELISALEKL